jgi:hypothetical protein
VEPSLSNCRRRPALHPPVPASAGHARCGLRMAQRFIMRTFAQVIAPPSVGAPSYQWTPSAVRGLLCSRFRGAILFRKLVSSPAAGLPLWRPPASAWSRGPRCVHSHSGECHHRACVLPMLVMRHNDHRPACLVCHDGWCSPGAARHWERVGGSPPGEWPPFT